MSTGNTLNGAQVIVDYLIQEKVPQVFGLCGHGNIQFIDALYGRAGAGVAVIDHGAQPGRFALAGYLLSSALPIFGILCHLV